MSAIYEEIAKAKNVTLDAVALETGGTLYRVGFDLHVSDATQQIAEHIARDQGRDVRSVLKRRVKSGLNRAEFRKPKGNQP